MKSQRLDMIEAYVLEHKNASLDTLCEKFNVSKNTIRRDVDILLKRGSIMKVYGGVAALETPQTLPLKDHAVGILCNGFFGDVSALPKSL